MKVLYVEDDHNIARTLVCAISVESRGKIQLVRFETPTEAARWLESGSHANAIITDWCMPMRPAQKILEGAGEIMLNLASRSGIPASVHSGSEKPNGFEIDWPGVLWFDKCDASLLVAWICELSAG